MSENHFDIQEVAKLIQLVETRGLTSLAYEHGDCLIEVKRDSAQVGHELPLPVIQVAGPPPPVKIALVSPPGASEERIKVEAPMLGVYYRSPSPDQPPFVEVGDRVEVGQTIGIIEAMKVFSEVPSEVAGIVSELGAKNGQLVHPGDVLVYLKS